MVESAARVAFVVALSSAIAACGISTPIEQQHPSVRAATPTSDDSRGGHEATALRTAASELGCAQVDIVLTLERRYANTSAPRYVIEGCGMRATYAETCEDYPRCRYLMLSLVPVPARTTVPAPPPGSAPSAPPASHDL